MKRLRRTSNLLQLTNGPGKLTEAMVTDKSLHRGPVYLRSSEIAVRRGREERDIARGFRIGVTSDLSIPLRFYAVDSSFVSVKKNPMSRWARKD